MSAATVDRELEVPRDVRVIHALRGRLRVHLVTWTGKGQWRIESRLRAVAGVRSAEANPLTGNVLIQYDHAQIDEVGVLEALHTLCGQLPKIEAEAATSRPPAHTQAEGQTVRARIAVRGLDRSPHLAQHIVERLQRFPGVRARANPLTGRVLVEFAKHEADIDELIAEVADVELPELPDEDRPVDPLDPAPLIQSVTRTVGAALGFGLLAAQQLPGMPRPLVDPTIPAYISSVIGILRGFPFLRDGLRKMLGRNAADLALSVPNIATLALSNNASGLAVTGAESAMLLNEVRSRQAAWRHYEENLQNVAAATPGAVVRLESGETCPLDARIIEGFGTYTDRSARPAPVAPGQWVTAGSRLFGGPFVLEMQASKGFEPQERLAPLTPTLYDQYNRIVAPASLGYALATAVLTRSLSRTFMALLLVNPRVAVIGMEAANLDAATRVLRAGVIVAGTRPERTFRRPDAVLLDGPRLVSDRFEATSIVPLVKDVDTAELLALAGGVAAAAGSPWGGALRSAVGVEAVDEHFDGSAASARIRGVTYTLRPLDDFASVPEAAPLRQRGDYVLQLTSEREQHPLGLLALRPRLVSTLQDLIDVCRRQRVLLALLPGNDALTARAIAKRAGIAVLDSDDALGAIQSRQALGQYVAFVSDGAHAGKSFDACDLAIGLTDGRNPLAARADLLAPDLTAVAAIVEAGARRDAAVRDSVGFSAVANVGGAIWGFRGVPGIETASTIVYGAALAALADGWWRLRGGERPHRGMAQIVDPRPERWGDRTVESTLETLHTSEDGLATSQAAARRQQAPPMLQQRTLSSAIMEQLKSPLNVMLGAGAGISLLLGTPADVAIIGATVAANVFIGAWQERRASQVAQTLNQLGAAKARVLRDGRPVLLPAGDVVPGDVLLLGAGERITADARLIEAQGLEVDEAALTGESLPVLKAPDSPSNAARVVLDGSDITTGSGRAVAFAVGRDTRMGSIAAALAAATETEKES
ncbi:MAG: P-type ATPase, partial [Ktedonobacterales bacterium]